MYVCICICNDIWKCVAYFARSSTYRQRQLHIDDTDILSRSETFDSVWSVFQSPVFIIPLVNDNFVNEWMKEAVWFAHCASVSYFIGTADTVGLIAGYCFFFFFYFTVRQRNYNSPYVRLYVFYGTVIVILRRWEFWQRRVCYILFDNFLFRNFRERFFIHDD